MLSKREGWAYGIEVPVPGLPTTQENTQTYIDQINGRALNQSRFHGRPTLRACTTIS